jgi:kumamolisin
VFRRLKSRWWRGAGLGVIVAAVVATVAVAGPLGAGGSRPQASAARDLGRLGAGVRLRLELELSDQRSGGLARLIAAGRTVSPGTFERRFLPSRSAVMGAINRLAADGLAPAWTPGSQLIQADGSVAAIERAFAVRIERYERPNGTTYYAPTAPPRLGASLRNVVSDVSGLDDRARFENLSTAAVRDPSSGCGATVGGFTPAQVMSAYDFDPLLHDSLDGAGETIVFLEIDTFRKSDLNCFAGKFGVAPPEVTVMPRRWGSPKANATSAPGESEAELDLEIVHAIAPAARLVVYDADRRPADIAGAAQAAITAYPKAIFSISIGGCEIESLSGGQPVVTSGELEWSSALERLAATGGTAFAASGDSGAYACGPDLKSSQTGAELPSVSFPASDPYITAVGGTAMFLGAGGRYAGEAAWGGPFEGDGSGGGLSYLWRRPSWQKGRGVSNSYSDGARELPDVSALGDPDTGWNIYTDGSWAIVAGTSAAAPLWAGLTALADQQLAKHGLAPVGFANLPIYAFGAHPSAWPSPAFNDVTRGENLYYGATPGWDYASGWGTPNAGNFVADLLAYRKDHP